MSMWLTTVTCLIFDCGVGGEDKNCFVSGNSRYPNFPARRTLGFGIRCLEPHSSSITYGLLISVLQQLQARRELGLV